MELAAAFNPTLNTSGSFTALTMQSGSKIIIINKSYVDLIFTFGNGDKRLVIANDRRGFTLNSQPNPTVTWVQENIDYPQTINQLQNVCYVEVYQPSEQVSETYPAMIQRETLPPIIPYNIGTGVVGLLNQAAASTFHTIFPSSYHGVTVAPTTARGAGYDHYYVGVFGGGSTLVDIAGAYPATGKTANNGTIVHLNGSIVVAPGPFSLAGLPPIDSSQQYKGDVWGFGSLIPWSSSTTGYVVDFWINPSIPQFGQMNIFGDTDGTTQGGLGIILNPNNTIKVLARFAGGNLNFNGSTLIQNGTWYHVAILYSGTTTNTIAIYVNGVLDTSVTTSGAPISGGGPPQLGSIGPLSGVFTGYMANFAIGLTYSTTNQFMQPMNRFLLGQQSLNTDFQNGWITGFDLSTVSANSAILSYSLTNIQNFAGLMYPSSLSNFSPIRQAVEGDVFYTIGVSTTSQMIQVRFPNPLTNREAEFINFNEWANTGPNYTINVYGYNLMSMK